MTGGDGRRTEFSIDRDGMVLRGDQEGEGQPIVLCHGLSATRDLVVHNSRAIPRAGRRLILWDARGHGSSDPAPEAEGYGYRYQAEDLDSVVQEVAREGRIVVGGHSMGCHSAAAWALGNPERVAALVLIGPVFTGAETEVADDRWDARADALEDGGPEAFASVVGAEFTGPAEGRELVERLALQRARRHLHPGAVAQALREVPRSKPFPGLDSLRRLGMPTLVVGSHDGIDSGHPLSVARAWAGTIPAAEFTSEAEGESPLAWQGGRLSRVIDDFLDRAEHWKGDPDVRS